MRADHDCTQATCLRRAPRRRVTTLPVLLSTAQIARVLDVRDESSARRAIARWRARGVATHALPSTGGRRSHGVALADVACMVGLDETDVMRLAGVAA